MKKILNILVIAAALTVTLAGCKNGRSYTISGEMPDTNLEGCTVRLFDMEKQAIIDSTTISAGRFTFKGPLDRVTIAMVQAHDEKGMSSYYQNFILEAGDIHLNMVNDTLYGTPLNDKLYATFTADPTLRDCQMQMQQLVKQYYSAANNAEQESIYPMYAAIQEQYGQRMQAIARQAFEENQDNMLGAYALTQLIESNEQISYDSLNCWLNSCSSIVANYTPLAQARERLFNVDNTSEGKHFVDINGIDMQGNATTLSAMMQPGELTLIDFWASWCGPCRQEISENLIRLYGKYHAKGLNVIGIDVWDKPEKHAAAVESLGITYPQLIDTTERTATDLYGVNGVPTILLIGPDGTILARDIRGEEIEQAIKQNL